MYSCDKIDTMKKLAILINVLKVLISLSGVLMLIGWLVAPTFWAKPLSYLATIALPYVPQSIQASQNRVYSVPHLGLRAVPRGCDGVRN